MAGPSYRFTVIRDNAESYELRFYISYLYYQTHKNLLNGYDLSVMQKRGLKQHFTEMVAEELDIETEALEQGSFGPEVKKKLQALLNDLIFTAKQCIVPSFYTSWINSSRADFFLYAAIKLSIKRNILITSERFSKIYIGQVFWPELNSHGQEERNNQHLDHVRKTIIKRMVRKKKKAEPWKSNAELEELCLKDSPQIDKLVEKELAEQRELIGKIQKESDSFLDALRPIENYDPVNDGYSSIKILDHLNAIAFTQEAYREQNIHLIKNIYQLYKICYRNVSAYRTIVKNDSSELIDRTYERLIKQFDLTRFFPPVENPAIRQLCIVSFLDILCVTTEEDEFQERFKLIRDKFSLDKSECEDFTVALTQKQWSMLIDICKTTYPSKIKQELNKMIRTRHKEWKVENEAKSKVKS